MKKIALIAAMLMLLLSLGGCVYVGFTPSMRILAGRGDIVTREVDIASIETLSIGADAELELVRGDAASASITTYENYFDFLNIRTTGGKLDIYSDHIFENRITVRVVAPELNTLHIAGKIHLICDEPLELDRLKLSIAGYSDGTLALNTGKLDIQTAGACDLAIVGTAEELYVSSSGASQIDGRDLLAQRANIHVAGAGDISLGCEEQLTVSISGAGSVSYYGNPRVSQSIAGVGRITKAGD